MTSNYETYFTSGEKIWNLCYNTSSGHYYKQKSTFYIYSINNVYGLFYRPHTSINEW